MYSIQPLDEGSRRHFRDLTFPLFRPLLEDGGHTQVAIGAYFLGQPVGLALARMESGGAAQIHSLAVAPQHRKNGLGYKLLLALEHHLTALRIESVRCSFMSDLHQPPVIQKVLEKAQWDRPQPRMMICDSDLPTIMSAPWMHQRELPPTFEVFPWSSLREDERESLLCAPEQQWYPEELTPFRNEHLVDPQTSLGLRFCGKLVGWCLTHILDETTVRYSTLFVKQEHQKLGRAIPLLANSIFSLHKTSRFRARFDVALDNRPMFRFVHKRMRPYMLSLRYIVSSQKLLFRESGPTLARDVSCSCQYQPSL